MTNGADAVFFNKTASQAIGLSGALFGRVWKVFFLLLSVAEAIYGEAVATL